MPSSPPELSAAQGTETPVSSHTNTLAATPIELASSPPGRSPIKSSGMITSLPPIQAGSLKIMKRRRLEPNSPEPASGKGSGHNPVTPSKHRSFSSPIRPLAQRRAPSLQDSPIPRLSPPSPPGSIGTSPSDISTMAQPPSSASHSIDSPAASSLRPTAELRRVTSPLASKVRDPHYQQLAKSELELDRDLLKWRKKVDVARQAQKYDSKHQDDEDLKQSTENWREAAQKAATYLFNQAGAKVDRMGGMAEYLRRQKERDEFQNKSFEDEIDFDSLSPEEQERYNEMKDEYEVEVKKGKIKEEVEEVPTEFTMKYMLSSLKIDAELIFPDGFDT